MNFCMTRAYFSGEGKKRALRKPHLRDNYPTVEIGRKMGGYDDRTGVFSLTQTKARYWCRKPGASQTDIIEYSAKLLREAGLQIVSVHGNYLEVKASPGQVWEALSGQPSDPERESYHL